MPSPPLHHAFHSTNNSPSIHCHSINQSSVKSKVSLYSLCMAIFWRVHRDQPPTLTCLLKWRTWICLLDANSWWWAYPTWALHRTSLDYTSQQHQHQMFDMACQWSIWACHVNVNFQDDDGHDAKTRWRQSTITTLHQWTRPPTTTTHLTHCLSPPEISLPAIPRLSMSLANTYADRFF